MAERMVAGKDDEREEGRGGKVGRRRSESREGGRVREIPMSEDEEEHKLACEGCTDIKIEDERREGERKEERNR